MVLVKGQALEVSVIRSKIESGFFSPLPTLSILKLFIMDQIESSAAVMQIKKPINLDTIPEDVAVAVFRAVGDEVEGTKEERERARK